MNYEGCVSHVNTTLWTFELDNKIKVHIAHLAAHNGKQLLPEISEKVKIYNAHFMVNKSYQLEKLFLCDKSILICKSYKTSVKENALLKMISDHGLGVSDLLEIDYNFSIVNDFITLLTQQSTEQILIEVIKSFLQSDTYSAEITDTHHKCLNKIIPKFNLKSISSCQYVDSQIKEKVEGPVWSFGTHTKVDKFDILIGNLYINRRHGVILLCDSKYKMPCLITSRNKSTNKNSILNKFVLVKQYRVFTESYRDSNIPSLEFILFDIQDVLVLNIKPRNEISEEVFVEEVPADLQYVHDFNFKLLRKAPVSISRESTIECWLEILISNDCHTFLGLNEYQVQIAPFLKEDEFYQVFHNQKLKDTKNVELLRFKSNSVFKKFSEKTAVFIHDTKVSKDNLIPILNVAEAIAKIKLSDDIISFQGVLSIKKFTPALSSRTQRSSKFTGFGTPGSQTHTIVFTDDRQEQNLLLYLNNWENLQIPLGLIPYMRIYVRNVVPQKNKYLKSSSMTTFEVLSYEPPVFFDTANLSSNPAQGCTKYSFVGWGDLLPCNVLIWSSVVQLYVRSLKITSKCEICNSLSAEKECSCKSTRTLETCITLFVHDQMGQALVISKSVELLRLLLDLEPTQWNIWCNAFENIGQYVHNNEQNTFLHDSVENRFCKALALSINTINVMKISNLELKCRKMESSAENNEGMPTWFCIDARKRNEMIL